MNPAPAKRSTQIRGSSNIHWARHNPETNTMQVDFKDGKGIPSSTYEYANVDSAKFESFLAASSKGQWFAHHIRNAKHPHTGAPLHPATRITK